MVRAGDTKNMAAAGSIEAPPPPKPPRGNMRILQPIPQKETPPPEGEGVGPEMLSPGWSLQLSLGAEHVKGSLGILTTGG